MPQTDDVEAAVKQLMAPFSENGDDTDDEFDRSNAFWDFYTIGGRWAGSKQEAKYDPELLEQFYKWCQDEKITVSGIQWGKQELSPASQIPKVDAKWNELFRPGSAEACPQFLHSNRNHGALDGDVLKLADVPAGLKCSHVIFAAPAWNNERKTHDWAAGCRAGFMLTQTAWNCCNHMPVAWDGTFGAAAAAHLKALEHCADGYREQRTPTPDWLVVTVDYHS